MDAQGTCYSCYQMLHRYSCPRRQIFVDHNAVMRLRHLSILTQAQLLEGVSTQHFLKTSIWFNNAPYPLNKRQRRVVVQLVLAHHPHDCHSARAGLALCTVYEHLADDTFYFILDGNSTLSEKCSAGLRLNFKCRCLCGAS